MRKIVCLLSSLLLVAPLNARPKGMTYNAQEFQDVPSVAKKLVEVKVDALKKFNVKKVIIAECFGEFMESKEKADAVGGFAWDGGTTFKTTVKMGSDYYETVTNAVYDAVVDALKAGGIEVVEKDAVINNAAYAELGLKQESAGGGYKKGGLTSKASTTKTLKRSATDMGLITGEFTGPLKMAKLKKLLPQIAKDNGADAALKIGFFVDQGEDFAPVLSRLNVSMDCNLIEQNAGRGRVEYWFKTIQVALMDMQTPLLIDAAVKVKKDPFNAELYHQSLMTLIDSVVNCYKSVLEEAKAQP